MRLILLLLFFAPFFVNAQVSAEDQFYSDQQQKSANEKKESVKPFVPDYVFSSDSSKIERYCIITAVSGKLFSNKFRVRIDYGQQVTFFSVLDQRIKNEKGQLVEFNSIADALNYLALYGWTLHSSLVTGSDGHYTYEYIMKKTVDRKDLIISK